MSACLMCGCGEFTALFHGLLLAGHARIRLARGVQDGVPRALRQLRQHERNGLVVRVEEDQKIAVADVLAAPVDAPNCGSRKIDPEAAGELLIPLLLGHLAAVGGKPAHLLRILRHRALVLQETPAAEHRVLPPQPDDLRHEVV